MNQIKTCVITGCAGFIGSHLTEKCLQMGWYVWGIDKLSYCSYPKLMEEFKIKYHNQFVFEHKDINNITYIPDVDIVFNICAESHVDNSIEKSDEFIKSNYNGVHNLLEILRRKRHTRPLFYQMSTDEVYGDIKTGSHTESDILSPSNPYSSTKAGSDLLIMSYARTHNILYKIGRATNTYGTRQNSEKLIPKICKNLILNRPIPLHDFGLPKRTWLHVNDCVDGILTIVNKGEVNNIYNIGGNFETENWRITAKILNILGKSPGYNTKMHRKKYIGSEAYSQTVEILKSFPTEIPENSYEGKFLLIEIPGLENNNQMETTIYTNLLEYDGDIRFCDFSYSRRGQDIRYSLNDSKLRSLGWGNKCKLDIELPNIVKYYKDNFVW